MKFLSSWFRNLIAEEQVQTKEFHIMNPFAEKESADTVVLALSPATEEMPKTSLSIFWKDSSEKLYEKHLDDAAEAKSLWDSMAKDLEEAQTLAHEEKYDVAKKLSSELFEKYDAHTDTVVKMNNPPLTTTQASQKKQGKIIFQNIFFDTPEEAKEYQEKMKALQPNGEEGKPLWEQEGETGTEEDTSLSAPSVSYKDLEKQEAEEAKHLEKRIEKEVKDQIESTLEHKRATLFGTKDEELVDAMRGVGRTWEEIKDYMVKSLKYDKDGVDAFIDQKRAEEEGIEDKIVPAPPTPPEDLVSPETHDKLVKEVETPMEEPMDDEIANLSAKDSGEIKKQAENPLQEAPMPTPAQPQDDLFNVPDVSEGEGDTELRDNVPGDETPKHGDRVYVMTDPHGQADAGFEGTIVSTYSQKGDKFAVVSTEDGDLEEVPMHQVVKVASMLKVIARRNEDVIQLFVNDNFPKDKMPNWGTANLRINKEPHGWSLVNYSTPILYRADGDDTLYFNTTKYSVTTSKIQSQIRRNLSGPVVMTDEAGVRSAMEKGTRVEEPKVDEPKIEDKAPDLQMPDEPAKRDTPPSTPDPKISALSDELSAIVKEAADLTKEADEPETAPQEEPIQFKQPKIAPPHVDKEKATPATPEIAEAMKQVDGAMSNIEAIRSMIDEAKRRLNEEIRAIEEKGGRVKLESQLHEGISRLAALINATENKLVQYGDRLITFKEEEKVRAPQLSYKWQLDKVLDNVKGAKEFLQNAMRGAQSLAKKETIRELVVFPDKGKKRMSKLDKSASILDVLQDITENLMSALEIFNDTEPTPKTATK